MLRDVEPTKDTTEKAGLLPASGKAAAPDRRRLLMGGLVVGTTLVTLASRPAMANTHVCAAGTTSVSTASLGSPHRASCRPT